MSIHPHLRTAWTEGYEKENGEEFVKPDDLGRQHKRSLILTLVTFFYLPQVEFELSENDAIFFSLMLKILHQFLVILLTCVHFGGYECAEAFKIYSICSLY